MRINAINNINFKENTLSREMNSESAILMLRDPNASIKFQQSQEYARKADSVDSNPFVALGYKLYRTFNLLKNNEGSQAEEAKQFRAIA
ncbi:MAG: hypothetical protein NC408_00205 [Candidatus Gastranaerophilales bacterium]|nr:hypothetical protein [Candidatus Gastranaerophilales bacterium]MCM1072986.1 hypothetical protein [Bacteroides sp.]